MRRHPRLLLAVLVLCGFRDSLGYDWPVFNGGVSFSRETAELLEAPAGVAWEADLGKEPVLGSPVLADGRVFAGTPERFACLDAASGALLWELPVPVEAAAAVRHGRVYLDSTMGELICLDASDGTLVWKQRHGGEGRTSPLLVPGMVLIGVGRELRAFAEGDGRELWRHDAGGEILSSAAACRGLVYAGTASGRCFCLDAGGNPVWTVATAGGGDGASPALRDGCCFTFPGDGRAGLHALDAASGAPLWSGNPAAPASAFLAALARASTPAVGGEKVLFTQHVPGFFGSRLSLVCLDAGTGSLLWRQDMDDEGWGEAASPAISRDRVFACLGSRLCTFDLGTGDLLDERLLDAEASCSPALGNGLVLVGTAAGTLAAFQTPNRAPPAPAPDDGGGTATLGWAPAGPVTLRYVVELDDDGELELDCRSQIATLPGETSVTLPSLPPDSRWVWRVRAVDPDGALSPWSAPRVFTMPSAGIPAALADALFLTAVPQDGQVLLSWQDPPEAFDGYRLLVRDAQGRERSPIQLGRVESAVVGDLPNFAAASFRLSAVRADGARSPGIEAAATPRPPVSIGKEAFPSLDAAVAAAGPGDVIHLGPGTFEVRDLRIPEGVSLVGTAPGLTVVQGADPASPVLRAGAGSSVSMLTATKGSEGVVVEGPGVRLGNLILMGLGNGVHVLPGGAAEILHATISDNLGHGVWIEDGDGVLRNNIITYNGGAGILASGASQVSSHGNLFANVGGDYAGTASAGPGSLAEEPRFAAKAPGDYRLMPDSPCLDAGDLADPFGLEPAPNGGRADLGAYGNTPFAGLGGIRGGGTAGGQGCFLGAARRKR